MVEFAGYTFDDHQAAFVCHHVLDGHPILLFVHDSDGDIQFMCGAAGHSPDDAHVIGISHLLEHLRSIDDMPVVTPGSIAERAAPGENWKVQPIDE